MDWNGKRIFLRTRQGKVYSGVVLSVQELDGEHWFIELRDKFGKLVGISVNEIIEIKEENGDGSRY